jgi:hypothetical protein
MFTTAKKTNILREPERALTAAGHSAPSSSAAETLHRVGIANTTTVSDFLRVLGNISHDFFDESFAPNREPWADAS